jgi:hypothetical protein
VPEQRLGKQILHGTITFIKAKLYVSVSNSKLINGRAPVST